MPRPKLKRCLCFCPGVSYFKPRGIPLLKLEEVVLFSDEMEAIKLYYVDEKDQTESAGSMKISQPTFARILNSANKKIASALIHGKAIKIQNSCE